MSAETTARTQIASATTEEIDRLRRLVRSHRIGSEYRDVDRVAYYSPDSYGRNSIADKDGSEYRKFVASQTRSVELTEERIAVLGALGQWWLDLSRTGGREVAYDVMLGPAGVPSSGLWHARSWAHDNDRSWYDTWCVDFAFAAEDNKTPSIEVLLQRWRSATGTESDPSHLTPAPTASRPTYDQLSGDRDAARAASSPLQAPVRDDLFSPGPAPAPILIPAASNRPTHDGWRRASR